jgi:hypothetical protein
VSIITTPVQTQCDLPLKDVSIPMASSFDCKPKRESGRSVKAFAQDGPM